MNFGRRDDSNIGSINVCLGGIYGDRHCLDEEQSGLAKAGAIAGVGDFVGLYGGLFGAPHLNVFKVMEREFLPCLCC